MSTDGKQKLGRCQKHSKPASMTQPLQPAPSTAASPSSHCSGASSTPLPHVVMHVLGAPMHTKSGSITQLASQPSPSSTSPSSHSSAPSSVPLLHVSVHTL